MPRIEVGIIVLPLPAVMNDVPRTPPWNSVVLEPPVRQRKKIETEKYRVSEQN